MAINSCKTCHLYITEEQLQELINGKVIWIGGEYGTFILLKREDK